MARGPPIIELFLTQTGKMEAKANFIANGRSYQIKGEYEYKTPLIGERRQCNEVLSDIAKKIKATILINCSRQYLRLHLL